MSNVINLNEKVTINSIHLLDVINESRAKFGEPSLSVMDINKSILSEFSGEDVCFSNGDCGDGAIESYNLTFTQSIIIGMRESKAVRRAIAHKLEEMQRKLAVQQEVIQKMSDMSEVHALKSELMRAKAQIWRAEELMLGERRINEIITSKKSTDEKIRLLTYEARQNWHSRCDQLADNNNLEQVVNNLKEENKTIKEIVNKQLAIELK